MLDSCVDDQILNPVQDWLFYCLKLQICFRLLLLLS